MFLKSPTTHYEKKDSGHSPCLNDVENVKYVFFSIHDSELSRC